MADNDTARQRSGIDSVGMLGGLVALVLAGYALSDGFGGVAVFTDPRWLLAGAAIVVGVLMLASTLRPSRRKHDGN